MYLLMCWYCTPAAAPGIQRVKLRPAASHNVIAGMKAVQVTHHLLDDSLQELLDARDTLSMKVRLANSKDTPGKQTQSKN